MNHNKNNTGFITKDTFTLENESTKIRPAFRIETVELLFSITEVMLTYLLLRLQGRKNDIEFTVT